MFRHKIIASISAAMVMIVLSVPVNAESDKGSKVGEEFRKTATVYEDHAAQAVQKATHSKGEEIGRYLELSAIYREMAAIKRNAVDLAEQGRWDDINWNRYHELEGKRDRLMKDVGWSGGKSKSDHRRDQTDNSKDKNKHAGQKQKTGGHSFLKAAEKYEHQARVAREHAVKSSGQQREMYQELAETYHEMALLKREAAATTKAGKDYDWGLYRRLSERRDQLNKLIKHL